MFSIQKVCQIDRNQCTLSLEILRKIYFYEKKTKKVFFLKNGEKVKFLETK